MNIFLTGILLVYLTGGGTDMKKLALLLVMGLLVACGGGGGSGTTASGTPTSVKETGTVTVTIDEPKQTGKLYNYTSTTTNNIWRRVVVTNPSLNVGSRIFKQYYDYRKDTPPDLTFSIPYASGYTFEFLEYSSTPSSGFKQYSTTAITNTGGVVLSDNVVYPQDNVIKYAKAENVTIGSGSTNITLKAKTVLNPLITFPVKGLKFGAYSGVPGKTESASFQVQTSFTNISTPSMFSTSGWKLNVWQKETASNNITAYFSDLVSGNLATVNSPLVWANNELQLRGVGIFYLNDSVLLPGESYTKFSKRSFSFNDPTKFAPVVIRTTGVTIQ